MRWTPFCQLAGILNQQINAIFKKKNDNPNSIAEPSFDDLMKRIGLVLQNMHERNSYEIAFKEIQAPTDELQPLTLEQLWYSTSNGSMKMKEAVIPISHRMLNASEYNKRYEEYKEFLPILEKIAYMQKTINLFENRIALKK